MSRRPMLVLSAALSAIVLVFVGAAATASLRAASSAPAPVPPPGVSIAETVPVELVRAREAELRRLVDEANARLRARAEAGDTPVASPAPVAPRVAERGDEEGEVRRHGRHERKLAHNAHEEEDDDG